MIKNIKKSTVIKSEDNLPLKEKTQNEPHAMEEEKSELLNSNPSRYRPKLKDLDPLKCKLTSISFPRLVENPNLHAKYFVELTYKDENGNERRKTIKFGEKHISYYAETGDEIALRVFLTRLRNYDSWTKPSFYVYHLLCKSKDISVAYTNLVNLVQNNLL